MSETSLQDKYPAIDSAFAYVIPSYQFLLTRFEAADARLTTLLATLSAIALGAPTFAKGLNPDISFASEFFVFGELVFLAAFWFGIVQRTRGKIVLPDPMTLYRKSLKLSPDQFKMEQIGFAGQHFDDNANEITRKGNVANKLTIAIAVEVLGFLGWLITS